MITSKEKIKNLSPWNYLMVVCDLFLYLKQKENPIKKINLQGDMEKTVAGLRF